MGFVGVTLAKEHAPFTFYKAFFLAFKKL